MKVFASCLQQLQRMLSDYTFATTTDLLDVILLFFFINVYVRFVVYVWKGFILAQLRLG